jgi:hypothetical protein
MTFSDRLYVEIVALEDEHPPNPHPIREGRFDPAMVYKVLGVYNPSETSECYLMLVNPQRQIWFIPQRHLRAYKLIDSNEFFIPKRLLTVDGDEAAPRAMAATQPGRVIRGERDREQRPGAGAIFARRRPPAPQP